MRNTLMLALLLVAVPIVAQAAPDEHALRRELVQELAKHNVLPRDFARIASGGIYHTLAGSGHPLADRRISARPPAASRSEQTHLGKRRRLAVALPFRWAIWLRSGLASSGPGHQSAPDFNSIVSTCHCRRPLAPWRWLSEPGSSRGYGRYVPAAILATDRRSSGSGGIPFFWFSTI